LWKGTLAEVDVEVVVQTVDRLYSDPRNTPITWGDAVIVSGAMASGVVVTEQDLQIVRTFDADLH